MVALMKNFYMSIKTRGNNSPHIGGVLEIFNLHALTANVCGSSMFSDLVGGPSIHQMHRNIKHSIAVDCFVNKQRMEAHLTHFKKFINVLKESPPASTQVNRKNYCCFRLRPFSWSRIKGLTLRPASFRRALLPAAPTRAWGLSYATVPW